MTSRDKYNQVLWKLRSIFHELTTIIETIKDDFEEENRQDPRLTMAVVDFHLDIIRKYSSVYQENKKSEWEFMKELKSTRQNISSFHREFDNPFLGSQKWYQRIVELLYQLADQGMELDKLIEITEE